MDEPSVSRARGMSDCKAVSAVVMQIQPSPMIIRRTSPQKTIIVKLHKNNCQSDDEDDDDDDHVSS